MNKNFSDNCVTIFHSSFIINLLNDSGRFSTSRNRRPLTDRQKIVTVSATSTAIQNLVEICGWVLLGK